jgi:hypothetical protein
VKISTVVYWYVQFIAVKKTGSRNSVGCVVGRSVRGEPLVGRAEFPMFKRVDH